MELDDVDIELVRQVRALVYLGRRHPRARGYYLEAGAALLALQTDRPRQMWARIVQENCGFSPRRAYQLIALAAGKKTLFELRRENAARVQKHRRDRWLAPKAGRQRGLKPAL